jgi:hypothetical protein
VVDDVTDLAALGHFWGIVNAGVEVPLRMIFSALKYGFAETFGWRD